MATPYYSKFESEVREAELTSYILANVSSGQNGTETASTMGTLINSAANATPNDTDVVATAVNGGVLRKITHIALKAFYKLYFDTIYQTILVSGVNIKTLNGESIIGSGDMAISGGGGGGATNLSTNQTATNVTILSDSGADAIIALSNGTNAGVSINDYTTAEKTKLTGIANGATVNDTDINLKNRANHTGTQTASTISDIQSAITNNTAVVANTAKISFDSASSTRLSGTIGTNTGDDATNTQYSGLDSSKQNILSGTGFVKSTAGTISYDTNTYLTTVPAQSFASITGKPTTISGYGITDFNSLGDARYSLVAHTHTFGSLTSKPTTLSGYGITDAIQPNVNAVFTSVNSNVAVTLAYTSNVLNWTGLESNLLKIVLTRDSILANPSSPVTNAIYQFIVEQNATGLWTLTYGNNFKCPNGTVPVIDLNANSKGLLTAIYDGTHFLVVSAQNFL
jgi:hypothetical protein